MKPSRLRFLAFGAGAADNIALSQTPAAGGIQSLTLNGSTVTSGVATWPWEATVSLTFAAGESSRVFVVKGTSWKGVPIVEAIQGTAAGTVRTQRAFRTVTSIQVDANTAGAITVGWGTVFESAACPLNWRGHTEVGIQLSYRASSTGTITLQFTRKPLLGWRGWPDVTADGLNPNRFGSEFEMIHPLVAQDWINYGNPINPATASQHLAITGPVTAVRMSCSTAVVGTIEMFITPGQHF